METYINKIKIKSISVYIFNHRIRFHDFVSIEDMNLDQYGTEKIWTRRKNAYKKSIAVSYVIA